MRSGSVVGVILALAFAISGCGGDDAPSAATTSSQSVAPSPTPTTTPTPTTAPKVDCTKLLTQREAEALAGESLGRPKQDPVTSLPSCRWESASSGAWVVALAVPASTWADALPEVIGAALDSGEEFEGREDLDAALKLVEAGGTLDDVAACNIFSAMVHAFRGLPAGATRVVNYVPDKEAPQGINEQACLHGRYYSVQFISATLKAGPAVEKRIRQALRAVSD